MIRFLALGLLVALPQLAAPAVASAQNLKIGYVDLQRALNETEDGRRAKESLKKVFDKKQKELDEQSTALKQAVEDLNKKRTLLPENTRVQKETELQEKMKAVQETYLRHQKDLAKQESEVTGQIFERMQRIIAKMADAENFTMVLDKNQSGLVFAKPSLDLTNELIRRYNSGEGAGGGGTGDAAGKGGDKTKAKK